MVETVRSDSQLDTLHAILDLYQGGIAMVDDDPNIEVYRSELATVITHSGQNMAVKLPDDGDASRVSLKREALYQCMFTEAPTAPPLQVPGLIDCGDLITPPYYLAMQKIPGTVLDYTTVSRFSDEEKALLGEGIGRFAGWMSQVLDPGLYHNIVDSASSRTVVYDRAAWNPNDDEASWQVLKYFDMQRSLQTGGYTTLADVLFAALNELVQDKAASTRPTYVGHDDIRPANISFERNERGLRQLVGVFDFDLMKPLTPEREFRHLRLLGRVASQAATKAFQVVTGQKLYDDDIDFWARYQVTTAAAHFIYRILIRGGETNTAEFRSSLKENILALHKMFPEEDGYDWSELDRLAA